MSRLNFAVDHDLCFVRCSADLVKRLGGEGQQLLGEPYVNWFPVICVEGEDALRQVVESGDAIEISGYRFVSLDGAFTADVLIQPLKSEDGRTGARVQIGALKPCRLSDVISAKQGWSENGKVAAMLSHGVRNPLNAIKGAVTYLQGRYGYEAELQEFTGIMVEEISRLEEFISGFLSTSTQGSEPEQVNVNALLNKVANYTSLQAQVAGVGISLQCGDVLPVRIDAFQLEQAVLNLLNNALTVLVDGGRIVLSSSMLQQAGPDCVVVEVADNGPGMDPARVEALHDPASEPEPGKDRGFGLFITREVVTSYGGRLEIVSTEGQGTQVRLLLPAEKGEAEGQGRP